MTHGRLARLCLTMAVMTLSSASRAGVWGITPNIGLYADYNTNPNLFATNHRAQTTGAVLLDAPTAYNADAFQFTIDPSLRLTRADNYDSVDSPYAHIYTRAEWDNERGALKLSLGLLRDSSLYQTYLLNGTTGVERNTVIADVNWDRFLTELTEFNFDLSPQQVHFGEAVGAPTLTDYRYTSATPALSWTLAERGKLTASASAGLYNSLNGQTQSKSANVQLAYAYQLHTLWSWTIAIGYSHAQNREDYLAEEVVETPNGPALVVVPARAESVQNGGLFQTNVTRQTERLTLSLDRLEPASANGICRLKHGGIVRNQRGLLLLAPLDHIGRGGANALSQPAASKQHRCL